MSTDATFLDDVRRISREVAAEHADGVDRDARFPAEAIGALREIGGLSAYVPAELGGLGVSFETLAEACFELGRGCGAAAMVFAMHQIQVHSLVEHAAGQPWFEDYLRRLVAEQRLIASATSEVGTGGDMGKSVAALSGDGDERTFVKQAPTISYGAHADDLLTTVRRTEDADPGDQVLVLSSVAQTGFEPSGTWDPLGMRGTCSPGATITVTIPAEQVVQAPFAEISARSMVPASHLLWAHLWLGIATDAFDRARAFVRAQAARDPEAATRGGIRLSELMTELTLLRGEVHAARERYVHAVAEDPAWLSTMAATVRMNTLKIAASEQAPRICQGALAICGIVGYKNDTPFSVGRHLRDTLSAALMVTNERIHRTNAGLLLIAKEV